MKNYYMNNIMFMTMKFKYMNTDFDGLKKYPFQIVMMPKG